MSSNGDFAQPLAGLVQQQQVQVSGVTVAAITDVQKDGTTVDVSARSKLNFVTGTHTTLTVTDNPSSDSVDITIDTAVSVGKQLDRASITSDVTVTATTEGTAASVITGNSVTYDGTEVKVEFWCPSFTNTGDQNLITFLLLCDSTVIGKAVAAADGNNTNTAPVYFPVFHSPSAASHTYSAKVFVNTGTTIIRAGAGGSGNFAAAFLRVTKA